MEFERELKKWGDTSVAFIIPPDLLKFMDLQAGDKITITDDEGKHGKFIAFWKSHNMTNEQIREELEKKM